MEKLNAKNYFDRYVFNPSFAELSKTSQKKALAISITTGILTGGLLHLGVLVINLIRFKGRITKKAPQQPSTSKADITFKAVHRKTNEITNPLSPKNPKPTRMTS